LTVPSDAAASLADGVAIARRGHTATMSLLVLLLLVIVVLALFGGFGYRGRRRL
jgi:hypothetical protein